MAGGAGAGLAGVRPLPAARGHQLRDGSADLAVPGAERLAVSEESQVLLLPAGGDPGTGPRFIRVFRVGLF